jgi:Cu/Ag efflux protein CusF
MFMKSLLRAMFVASVLFASISATHAQSQPQTANAAETMSEGEVRKIDRSAGKMTIKHGPLKNLGMDGMTMVFRVSDPAMLDQVKPGDRIRFVAEQPNGQLTVTQLQKQD